MINLVKLLEIWYNVYGDKIEKGNIFNNKFNTLDWVWKKG